MNRRRMIFSSLAGLAAAGSLTKASVDGRSGAQLVRRSFQPAAGGAERDYFLYLPVGYHTETGRKWPVMLFLHGGGERGDGKDELKYTMIHGPLMEAWVQGRDLPFLIIQPQMPPLSHPREGRQGRVRADPPERNESGPPPPRSRGRRSSDPMARKETGEKPRWEGQGPPEGWWAIEKDLLMMIDGALRDNRGDPDRVYVTGLSYGGFGTWHMASAHTDLFAAAAPICGVGNAEQATRLAEAKTPIWIFQGGRDGTVHPEWTLETARRLEVAGHPLVRMTVHEDLGHNVWTRVYEGWDLYNWFLEHRRGGGVAS